jgi:hypothetical protein
MNRETLSAQKSERDRKGKHIRVWLDDVKTGARRTTLHIIRYRLEGLERNGAACGGYSMV